MAFTTLLVYLASVDVDQNEQNVLSDILSTFIILPGHSHKGDLEFAPIIFLQIENFSMACLMLYELRVLYTQPK